MDQTPQRILLIEDNPDHALVASRILQRAGYEVETAPTGREGIDAVNTGNFELVLLDYGLPDMDGMSVLAEISKIGTPVVFVTGRSDAKLAVDALRAGATNYIIKDAHYVSNLPDVARSTLERQSDRLKAVNVTRVRLREGDEDTLHRFFSRFLAPEAILVRYAAGDYLVFGHAGGNGRSNRLDEALASFRSGGAALDLNFEHFTLDAGSSLRDRLA